MPSRRPVPNHAHAPLRRFVRRFQRVELLQGFAMNEQARRTCSPNRVRSPTGRPFASGCSPPRLAAARLPSATHDATSCGGDFHPVDTTRSRTHSFPAPRSGDRESSEMQAVALDSRSVLRPAGNDTTESGGFCEVRGAILGRRDADLIEAGLNEGAASFARLGYGDCIFCLPPDRII